MSFLDCYAIPQGEKGHLDGFPESTFEIDVSDELLNHIVKFLALYFAEVREVEVTNGQAILPLTEFSKEYGIDTIQGKGALPGVPRRAGAGKINMIERSHDGSNTEQTSDTV